MNENISIFVTNFSRIDLADATRFLKGDGEIVYITEGKTNIFREDGLKRDIESAIETMQTDDYLLVAGNSAIASYCTGIVMKKFGGVNLLIWDHNGSSYHQGTV
jgi:hypothetical protein